MFRIHSTPPPKKNPQNQLPGAPFTLLEELIVTSHPAILCGRKVLEGRNCGFRSSLS